MALRILSGIFAVLFVFSAYVQLNDPDAARWIAIYLAAAAVSTWRAARPIPAWVPAAVMVVALGWAVMIAPGAAGKTSFGEMFGSIGMKDEAAEIGREIVGLLLVAFWMAVIALAWFKAAVAKANADATAARKVAQKAGLPPKK